MKMKSLFRLSILFAISSTCYGAQYLTFRADGAPGTELGGGWSQSEPNNSPESPKAFYSTVGSNQGVSVGAYYDSYNDPNGFYAYGSTNTIYLTDTNINWNFTISDRTGDPNYTTRNDYQIYIPGAGAIDFRNNGDATWNVSVNNDPAFVAVEAGYNYNLFMLFDYQDGHVTYDLAINGFNAKGLLSADPSQTVSGFYIAEIASTNGVSTNGIFGDGFITIVPEPGTPMLLSLLPAFFILRRRR